MILHEGQIDKRVQYMIEVMYAIRKDGFKVRITHSEPYFNSHLIEVAVEVSPTWLKLYPPGAQ